MTDIHPPRSSRSTALEDDNNNNRDSFDSFVSSSSSTLHDPTESNNDSAKAHQRPLLPPTTLSDVARNPSVLEEHEEQPLSTATAITTTSKSKEEPVTWMSLPKKGQLAVLTIARLSEPLSERSLAAYMFFQLKWFDPSLPDSTIASQGGLLTAAFAAAQFFTAVWWGHAADTPWIGRKKVLLVGLMGTAIASIGVGFSKTFYQAFFFRALAGALNGNIGVMRTMLSEIIQEKRYQSRAFLLLPMCFNIGVIIGPILGGFLADPITSFPNVFGPGSTIGGKTGVTWMTGFPYALPNLFSGIFILISAFSVVFGLDETHEALREKPDSGRKIGRAIARVVCRRRGRAGGEHEYARVATDEMEMEMDNDTEELQMRPIVRTTSRSNSSTYPRSVPDPTHQRSPSPLPTTNTTTRTTLTNPAPSPPTPKKSPLRRILTKNVLLTLSTHHLLALHVSTFNALIFLLLPTPHAPPPQNPTLHFTGGLSLSQSRVGLAMATLGTIGLPLQLLLYPSLTTKLGTLPAYRLFLPFSILAYTALPFLVLLPTDPAYRVWILLSAVLASQVLSRTFALTGTVILVNNSSPGSDVLGTVHGVAQSVSSAARMLGPTVGGWLLGVGLRNNLVGGVWWGMAVVAAVNWALLWFVFEGDGKGGRA